MPVRQIVEKAEDVADEWFVDPQAAFAAAKFSVGVVGEQYEFDATPIEPGAFNSQSGAQSAFGGGSQIVLTPTTRSRIRPSWISKTPLSRPWRRFRRRSR